MRLLVRAALLVALSISPARADTQIYVDGRLCGVVHDLAYAGVKVGALDCRADVVPRRVTDKDRDPLPRGLELDGRPIGDLCDLYDPAQFRLRSLSCTTLVSASSGVASVSASVALAQADPRPSPTPSLPPVEIARGTVR